MRSSGVLSFCAAAMLASSPASIAAQDAAPTSRQAVIEQEQAAKVKTLHPIVPSKAEEVMGKVEDILAGQGGGLRWHPFFDSAYSGGGFTLGAGYGHHVSPYNTVDARGSYTIKGYKRVEGEFAAPRLFRRRGSLSVVGGWREATQVGFYGIGINTAREDRTNYGFEQPYASAVLTLMPTRRNWVLRGGLEYSRWSQEAGSGSAPSIETKYTPSTLNGLGAATTYLHSEAAFGFDWRPSPGYARRGGFYGLTLHDYTDPDEAFGFQQVDYEVVQHIPILREAWVISLHGAASTAFDKGGQELPFFMLPSLGSGSTLRGYPAWRFRDHNSLLFQAEWRIMVNRFFDTAFFYDTGKVATRTSDLDLDNLKSDFGFGIRFHGPADTPLRIELARSPEGFNLVFASSHVF